ncbi:MAG TPA: hypothetical protein VFH73_20045, partial [Polyangia bacterium]|nr:hypothetical protein [Polyangia bacterium]
MLFGVFAGCGDDSPAATTKTDAPIDTNGGDVKVDVPDAGDTGMDAPVICPTGTFVKPLADAMLTAADDKDGDSCVNGFQYDVTIATNAPAGTSATLFANATQVGMAQMVTGATVTFAGATLNAQGPVELTVQFGTDDTCKVKASVMVNCMVPTCNVTAPVISAMHPKLNGVAEVAGGDRASSAGSPYQVSFEVTTNIEDGRPVSLRVAQAANPNSFTTVNANALAGKASVAGVTLVPDGDFTVQATCTNAAGVAGKSTIGTYPVDTTAPDLTVTEPVNGKHFNPTDLTNGAFKVCGATMAADAKDLPATLGAAQNNFQVGVGMQTDSIHAPMPAAGIVCVDVMCPGGAAFDLNVTLKDGAGNPLTKKITGVSCTSKLPSVQIVSPLGDSAPFADATKHLLSASSMQAVKDQVSGAAGAQFTVVACSDKTTGTARLFGGQTGGTLAAIGAAVPLAAAQTTDNCPAGFGGVARFTNATLPESAEQADGTLVTPTQLRVDVTDESATTGPSATVDLWVDSAAPSIQQMSPSPLCGITHQSAVDWITNVRLITTTSNLVLS